MNIIIGKVLSENVKEQPAKDFGTGPVISFLHELTINGKILGKEDLGAVTLKISKFNKNNSPLTTAGTEVKTIYSSKKGTKPLQDGTLPEYHNLEELEVLKASTEAPTASVAVLTSPVTHTRATSKDVSMEVSGLLQALINSGVAIEDLESRLRSVLDLKRSVAKDYE